MAGQRFLAEHGLSYYIEYKDKSYLLDTGHTDVYLRNAEKMGLNIQQHVDTIFLSHGHWDHGNGLRYLDNKTLVAHPGVFIKRYHKGDKDQIGLTLNRKEIEARYRLIVTKKAYEVQPGVFFLGEIPRKNRFESKTTMFIDEHGYADYVPDDSALCFIEDGFLIIVTGCSHSGICNIVEYAKRITGINGIKAVIGGFHLKNKDSNTDSTIEYLKKQEIRYILPSHCTELPALSAFYDAFGSKQVKTGMTFDF